MQPPGYQASLCMRARVFPINPGKVFISSSYFEETSRQGRDQRRDWARQRPGKMKKVGVSWGERPKMNWAAPSASVIPIPKPRLVQDGDYVTYWAQPGETGERAGINQSGWRCSDLPRGRSLETSAKTGGREAETLAALASTPRVASGSY